MKVHDVQQGSPEWFALRLGIPTASEFERIVTPTGKLSSQARKFACYLAAEILLGRTLQSLEGLEWIERGRELEPQAVRMYEWEQDVETQRVGFVTTDDGAIGASPDRLIPGQNAGLEIKCPAPQTHVAYMVDGFGTDYRVQVQGQCWVAELDYVDRYSFHPEMPPVLIRTPRDEAFIKLLSQAVRDFVDMKEEILEVARARGHYRRREQILLPHDLERGEQATRRPDTSLQQRILTATGNPAA